MSLAIELNSQAKPGSEMRKILGPGGNSVRVFEEEKRKNEGLKKKLASDSPIPAKKLVSSIRKGDDGSSRTSVNSKKKGKDSGDLRKGAAKAVPDVGETLALSPQVSGPVKRCHWITPNSEPIYTAFHDGEWGVPVNDEIKLFELLVLSQALAELSWPTILSKRETFRKLFDNFDPISVASIDEKKSLTLKTNGNALLSEQKLRAITENSKQVLKIQEEFGSFSNYMWRFVNYKPIQNSFQYTRQVPAKTPKSELISKDLMNRGFRCVGPTVVYSFMQVAGMVNDHLVSCFRYNECSNINFMKNSNVKPQETELTVVPLERAVTTRIRVQN